MMEKIYQINTNQMRAYIIMLISNKAKDVMLKFKDQIMKKNYSNK